MDDEGRSEDTNEDLSNEFVNLSLKSRPEKTEDEKVQENDIRVGNEQRGNQTPEQKRVTQGARPKTAIKQLFSPKKSTKKTKKVVIISDEENDEGSLEKKDGNWLNNHPRENEIPNRKPEQKRVAQGARPKTAMKQLFSSKKSTKKTKEVVIISDEENDEGSLEKKDGNWLNNHPWENETPNPQETMTDTVTMSKVYTVSDEWRKSDQKKLHKGDVEVDLKKIYSNLPEFIKKMKIPSLRQEVQAMKKSPKAIVFKDKPFSHMLEIEDEVQNKKPTDKPSRREADKDNSFMAYSLQPQQNQQLSESYWYLDCEYMLAMYLPRDSLQWFNVSDGKGKRIRAIKDEKKDNRWIFIPSFRRAQIALLEWPEDDIVTPESTIRILVVRPSEFDEYVKYCGHLFPVISLPQDEIGAGYPRFWIQKIALRLKLDFIWMIDDSVECFYEYHHTQKPPKPGSFTVYRRRKFGLVFQRIEELVKATKKKTPPIAAMSPKRFIGGTKVNEPFVCSPPRIAVFLNLAALKSKDVYYRPELQALEDMIFGYECEQNGLKVFIDNRVHLQDHDWQDTGARSASVQQKQT